MLRSIVIPLASARLTRVVTADLIGEELLIKPIDKALAKMGHPETLMFMRQALDCKWCVGFWIASGLVAGEALTKGTRSQALWRVLTDALAVNYVAAHLANYEEMDVLIESSQDALDQPETFQEEMSQ